MSYLSQIDIFLCLWSYFQPRTDIKFHYSFAKLIQMFLIKWLMKWTSSDNGYLLKKDINAIFTELWWLHKKCRRNNVSVVTDVKLSWNCPGFIQTSTKNFFHMHCRISAKLMFSPNMIQGQGSQNSDNNDRVRSNGLQFSWIFKRAKGFFAPNS